ncbi:hypothetical protein NH00_19855, partial [Enterobacter cancerogenus]
LSNVLLAGGLSADNCVEAAQLGCAGLDFNSGVESAPGIKDASKVAADSARCAPINFARPPMRGPHKEDER